MENNNYPNLIALTLITIVISNVGCIGCHQEESSADQ
jgi:hypothetical protein